MWDVTCVLFSEVVILFARGYAVCIILGGGFVKVLQNIPKLTEVSVLEVI